MDIRWGQRTLQQMTTPLVGGPQKFLAKNPAAGYAIRQLALPIGAMKKT